MSVDELIGELVFDLDEREEWETSASCRTTTWERKIKKKTIENEIAAVPPTLM